MTRVWQVTTVGTQGSYLQSASLLGFQNNGVNSSVRLQLNGLYAGMGQNFSIPANWSTFKGLSCRITNNADHLISMGFGMDSDGVPVQLRNSVELKPGESKVVFLDLSRTRPANHQLVNPLPVFGEKYAHIYPWNEPNLASVRKWFFYLRTTLPATVEISDIYAHTAMPNASGCLDSFGQSNLSSWPWKVQSVSDLVAQKQEEDVDLAQNPPTVELSGTTRWPATSLLGRWRTHRTSGGTWYFISPQGRYFWSLGVVSVNQDTATKVSGREFMFQGLPQAGDPRTAFYGSFLQNGSQQVSYSHYMANVSQKYGDTQAWASRTSQRLLSWGFNSLGTGGDWAVKTESGLAYTNYVYTNDISPRISNFEMGSSLADPFSSLFQGKVEAALAAKLGQNANDPRLMGIFVDGEIPWGLRDGTARQRYGFPLGVLRAPNNQPAKVAFHNQLRAKYSTVAALNAAWGTDYASWTDFLARSVALTDAQIESARADLSAFLRSTANTYYAKIRNAVRVAAPNTLYLGSKDLMHTTPEEALAGAEGYCDVVSMDLYYDEDAMPWARLAAMRKPVLFGEFAIQAREGGAPPVYMNPHVDYGTQAERALAVKRVLDRAIRLKTVVGIHWWRYIDEPTLGKANNGENYHTGLVNVTDRPYYELIAVMREFSSRMYATRGK